MNKKLQNSVKADFPILKRKIHGKEIIFLDSAASSQKPKAVIQAIVDFYQNHYANIHRGVYQLSEEATEKYENARQSVADFIKSKNPESVIFTAGTTASINFIANTWAKENIKNADIIATTELEHHSNLMPWQRLARYQGASLAFIPCDEIGQIALSDVKRYLNPKVKLLAITGMSNVSGAIPPLKEIIESAHEVGAKVLLDGAQLIPHCPVDVQALDIDFLAFSAHKMLGPTGIGVLYIKPKLMDNTPPYQLGGGMISSVALDEAVYADPPARYEAGTPNIAGAIGLEAAIDYLQSMGMELIQKHEKQLTQYAIQKLTAIKGFKLIGPTSCENRGGVISFILNTVHPHDLATILDSEMGICIRAGHHCAMPFHKKIGLTASCRASLYLYNQKEDIDNLVEGIKLAQKIFT